MENTQLITQFLQSLDASVDSLKPEIAQLISKSFEDRCNESDGLEQVQLGNGYAYTLVSLCFAYLKSQGVDTAKHPIMDDLERVKSYMKRHKQVESGEPEVQVDTSVAKKFIQGVLGREPAISSSNFRGTHTKFDDDKESIRTKLTKTKEKKDKTKEKKDKRGKVHK